MGPRTTTSSSKSSSSSHNQYSTLLLLTCGVFGFFAGTSLTLHTGLAQCHTSGSGSGPRTLSTSSNNNHLDAQQVEQIVQQRLQELQQNLPKCSISGKEEHNIDNQSTTGDKRQAQLKEPLQFPVTTGRWANGMARVSKVEFHKHLDTGVPLDLPQGEDSDALIIFGPPATLPDNWDSMSSAIPKMEPLDAVQNCNFLNIILTNHDRKRNQCLAIMPQYESYHIQKWMRLSNKPQLKKQVGGVDPSAPLVPVSRGLSPNGQGQFFPPNAQQISKNWDMLSSYFENYQSNLDALRPLAAKVATPGNTVTVMLSNWGQSELLSNFVCAAKSRNLDTSSVLVFATDPETKELAESLGLVAYYDEKVCYDRRARVLSRCSESLSILFSHSDHDFVLDSPFVYLLLLCYCIDIR